MGSLRVEFSAVLNPRNSYLRGLGLPHPGLLLGMIIGVLESLWTGKLGLLY